MEPDAIQVVIRVRPEPELPTLRCTICGHPWNGIDGVVVEATPLCSLRCATSFIEGLANDLWRRGHAAPGMFHGGCGCEVCECDRRWRVNALRLVGGAFAVRASVRDLRTGLPVRIDPGVPPRPDLPEGFRLYSEEGRLLGDGPPRRGNG